jgi:hypothetical protein
VVLRAPESSTMASWAASASNLLGAVTKGSPVALATSAAIAVSHPFLVFSPVNVQTVVTEEHASQLHGSEATQSNLAAIMTDSSRKHGIDCDLLYALSRKHSNEGQEEKCDTN